MMRQHREALKRLSCALAAADLGHIECDVSLAECSWYEIGGLADIMVHPHSAQALQRTLAMIKDHGVPMFVMGDGSNVIFDDAGFRGVVVRLGQPVSAMAIDGTRVKAEAGLWVPRFALELARRGLSGLEHIAGIPGTLGGLIVMNGGSQRKGIGTHVTSVTCLDDAGEIRHFNQQDCAFGYRRSALQKSDCVVLSAEFELDLAPPSQIRREMIDILATRRKKFPKHYPNCGSVFLSDPMMYDVIGPPGKAVEEVGLRGLSSGAAQISSIHGNFIVNRGGASARDVLWLIYKMRQTVGEKTGYWMDCEVRFVSQQGAVMPAHQAADVLFGAHLSHALPAELQALL
ncbi:MAG: UDP-N-acetylmuramate dehydrogenase [Pseudomonadota bacterium]